MIRDMDSTTRISGTDCDAGRIPKATDVYALPRLTTLQLSTLSTPRTLLDYPDHGKVDGEKIVGHYDIVPYYSNSDRGIHYSWLAVLLVGAQNVNKA